MLDKRLLKIFKEKDQYWLEKIYIKLFGVQRYVFISFNSFWNKQRCFKITSLSQRSFSNKFNSLLVLDKEVNIFNLWDATRHNFYYKMT